MTDKAYIATIQEVERARLSVLTRVRNSSHDSWSRRDMFEDSKSYPTLPATKLSTRSGESWNHFFLSPSVRLS